jgi:hypothetical protein
MSWPSIWLIIGSRDQMVMLFFKQLQKQLVFSSPVAFLFFGSISYLFYNEYHWNLLNMERDSEE